MNDNTRIAGLKEIGDWKKLRERIRINPDDSSLWEEAYNDFLYTRLYTRYFRPVELIDSPNYLEGEGFAIMAIYCSLIEFLEALFEGKKYEYKNPDKEQHEYNGQDKYFINFLLTKKPFKPFFTQQVAEDFYSSVRCGLLHEAQTNNGWKILVKQNGKFIDFIEVVYQEKVIYRDNFGLAIKEYLKDYKSQLLKNKDRQDAFVRKFNALCDLAINF